MSAHARAQARFKREVALASIREQRSAAVAARAEAAKAAEPARAEERARRQVERGFRSEAALQAFEAEMAGLVAAGQAGVVVQRQLARARIRAEGCRVDAERAVKRRKRRRRQGPSSAVCARPRRRPDWIGA